MSVEADERALEQAAEQRAADLGVYRISMPTPFKIGRVNVYLIEDEPLSLLDCGPQSAEALQALEQGMAELGHRIEDLGLLIITHQHIDHFGLASVLAQRSGAEVACLEALVPYLHNFERESERDDAFAQRLMLRHGVPAQVADALRAVTASFRGWGASVEVARPLRDGARFSLRDRTLQALHRPGHSPSDTIFFDEEGRLLFAGDHLLKHVSSNAVITRPLPSGSGPLTAGSVQAGERPRALVSYLDSLRQTREMDVDVALPGHGAPIVEHAALIDDRMKMHARRAEKIRRLIVQRARSAHEIALEMWGNVAVTQAYLTLSEVLGHIDLLLEDERIVEVEREGTVIFEAPSGAD